MQRLASAVLLAAMLLTGCSMEAKEMNRAVDLRSRLLTAPGCSFQAEITADYGDSLQQFTVDCRGDGQGNLDFQVQEPETIRGITGRISQAGGRLTFDETALQFDLLTDQQLSPVSAPWVFLSTLRGGYLTGAGMEGELLRLQARDSYREGALLLDIWLDGSDSPVRAEILWNGWKVLTLQISGFRLEERTAQAFLPGKYNFTTCVG